MFNNNPEFEKVSFAKAVKCSDGKYFIAAAVAKEDEVSQDIFCQFGPNLICKTNLDSSSSVELHIANESVNEFISECDDHFLAMAKDNKESWFPSSEITDTYLENALLPSSKMLKKQSSVFNFKARPSKTIEIYNSSKETIEASDVLEGSKVSIIVHLAGLWFTKTRFGLSWVIKQVKLHDGEKSLKVGKCLFADDVAEDEMDNVFPDE